MLHYRRRLRRRNPWQRNPGPSCPHCAAGLRQKHVNNNQCWRCKRELSSSRGGMLFGRGAGQQLGIAAHRRRRMRRYNPFWDSVKSAMGSLGRGAKTVGSVAGKATLAAGKAAGRGVAAAGRGTKKWYDEGGRDKMVSMGKKAARGTGKAVRLAGTGISKVSRYAGKKLQAMGEEEAVPAAARWRSYYRYNPCIDCDCDPCTCGTIRNPSCGQCAACGWGDIETKYCNMCRDCHCDDCMCGFGTGYSLRKNPCEDCDCDPCECAASRRNCGIESRYRYNPCECDDCDCDPCICSSSSRYRYNPYRYRRYRRNPEPMPRYNPW